MRIIFIAHNDFEATGSVIYTKGALFYLFILLLIAPIIKKFKVARIPVLLFSVLIAFSLIKSPNISAGILYVLNTWMPLIILIIWCSISAQYKYEKVQQYSASAKYILNIIIFLYILFWVLNFDNAISWELSPFINYHRTGDIDDFFIGNTTKLFGSTFYRNASIIMDPIVAGYFFAQFSFVMFIFKRYLYGAILFAFLLLTLSKGAFILFTLSFFFYFCYQKYSFKLNIILTTSIVVCLIIIALNSAGKNSSYIHALGLIFPFFPPVDLNYIVGHNISTGGGLTGTGSLGLKGGMESLVGTLQYQMGLTGVALYFIIFYKLLRFKHKNSDKLSSIEFCVLNCSFINSFLQENAFNLPFTVIKIFCLLYVVNILSSYKWHQNGVFKNENS